MVTGTLKKNDVIVLPDKDFKNAVKLFENPVVDLNKVNEVVLRMRRAKKNKNINIH
ncbi:hypothetical protein HCJ66_05660 [Listeria sp. FSL L7-1582]|uniref:Uncharacterized protein n=1 Tax=Listeria newyorkensis TaxID=1497681 RepID=A0A841YV24_9LIST|nr:MULTISPECIES: hypothetical protein [Listeria]KMT61764.1 hypothetical protein X559_1904 [Listeria newyorkensis]MBC1456822.1 hypothetical protein [Listeria newyorkensis]MBC6309036.1 hypothetical protein [Listeria portnoyi]WAO22020.1 hypothetical protein OTR81_01615 [Listeria newyorkensis]SQC59016.1 Uncharacterised protein [Listeria newyorkensis]